MESATQFDLNDALRQWREALAASPALRRDDLDQLEAHLRDGTKHWMAKGLTPSEAFSVAKGRLGAEQQIAGEFAKINAREVWVDRLLWIAAGSIAIQAIMGLAHAASFVAAAAFLNWWQDGVLGSQVAVLVFVVTLAATLVSLWKVGASRSKSVSKVFHWFEKHPAWSGLLALGALTGHLIVSILPARFLPLQDWRTLAIGQQYVGLLSIFLWPLALVWLLALRRPKYAPTA
jgi:hypothetical protein